MVFLVMFHSTVEETVAEVVERTLKVFSDGAQGLKFTFELPTDGCLQFLDLCIFLNNSHVCWMYRPRSKKDILLYHSAHSKLVKRGIVRNCMRGALKKSCPHKVQDSIDEQVTRLGRSGYPKEVIASVAEGLLKELYKGDRSKDDVRSEPNKRRVAFPYMHGLSHRLKKVAAKNSVSVVLTAPNKLGRLCHAVIEGNRDYSACTIKLADA